MIELHSLSKGNYVYCIEEKLCGEVEDIFISKNGDDIIGIRLRGKKVYNRKNEIRFINIDANWLWYLGFIRHNENSEFHESNPPSKYSIKVDISHGIKSVIFSHVVIAIREYSKIRLSYVHEFQNQYYLITSLRLAIRNFSKRPERKIDNTPIDFEKELFTIPT